MQQIKAKTLNQPQQRRHADVSVTKIKIVPCEKYFEFMLSDYGSFILLMENFSVFKSEDTFKKLQVKFQR